MFKLRFSQYSLQIILVSSLLSGAVMVPPTLANPGIVKLRNPSNLETWQLIQRSYDRGDYSFVWSTLYKFLKEEKDFAEGHSLLGATLVQMGNPQGALDSIDKALSLNPKLASAYAHRGSAMVALGDLSSALTDFDRATDLDPSLASAYFERGNTHYQLGDLEKAIADYTTAVSQDSSLTSAYTNRGAAYMTVGEVDRAIADFSKALRTKPRITYPILANRSEAYSIKKKYKAALKDADQAIRANPRYGFSYIAKGAALTGLEDYPGAEVNFARAIQLDSTDSYAYYWRGLLRLKKGDTKSAISDYEEALQLNPDLGKGGYENYSLVATQPTSVSVSNTQVNSAPNVYKIAKQTTVLIDGQNSGSGVIIAKNNNTYYVLTAKHVVGSPDEYYIISPSGKEYKVNYSTVKKVSNYDLALVEFQSNEALSIATIGPSESLNPGENVFVSGWPAVDAAITKPSHLVTNGNIAGIRPDNGDGYELLYSNTTGPGMSGGPVFNQQGKVIGIHGRASGNADSGKTGINLGIPIHLFIQQATQNGLDIQAWGLQSR